MVLVMCCICCMLVLLVYRLLFSVIVNGVCFR